MSNEPTYEEWLHDSLLAGNAFMVRRPDGEIALVKAAEVTVDSDGYHFALTDD